MTDVEDRKDGKQYSCTPVERRQRMPGHLGFIVGTTQEQLLRGRRAKMAAAVNVKGGTCRWVGLSTGEDRGGAAGCPERLAGNTSRAAALRTDRNLFSRDQRHRLSSSSRP